MKSKKLYGCFLDLFHRNISTKVGQKSELNLLYKLSPLMYLASGACLAIGFLSSIARLHEVFNVIDKEFEKAPKLIFYEVNLPSYHLEILGDDVEEPEEQNPNDFILVTLDKDSD